MGFNTVAVLYNDHTSQIAGDDDLGRRIAQAMRRWSERDRDGLATWFGSGMVVSQAHADHDQIVIVGQNRGRPLHECADLPIFTQEQLADALKLHGWTVKPPRKAPAAQRDMEAVR